MSGSRGRVPELETTCGALPPQAACLGKMCWLLFLWGTLHTCPTQASVLLAQQLPQQVTSPGYPEPYLKGQESHTDIEAPEGFVVRLVFQDFDIEPSPGCEGDSVTISTRGTDAIWLCGQHASSLESTPGHREFVSSGRSLRLTFRAHSPSQNKITHSHKGFLALYQAVAVNQPNGDSEAVTTPGADCPRIQNHCQDPYYEAKQTGTFNCPSLGTWKDRQDKEQVPQCVPVCGRPVIPIAQNPKTSGSSPAKLGNFPWQAFTSIYGRGGGALLGDRWILTAAHTIYPKDSVYLRKNKSVEVFLGHTDVDELLKLGNHPVRRVVVHPDYRQHESHNFNGDIALLELQHSVPLGPNLLPVCLPDNETLYHSGLWGYVSGFGVEMGWLTTKLKYSQLPVAPREACEAWLHQKQRTEVFSDNMFCAGDENQVNSVCQGDSGSVYVVWDNRTLHWVATGIVSWGIGCGKGYGFYTKVLSYVDWIKRVMDGKD
ncbi:complement C1r subcomponent-like protein [Cricetulus griseus]|uniref:Complement C1r subcomponent-like protein n=1 Tax=Cricetulus griseus TaxID=10029 RepID=A0A8C2LE47_CRIGR|nr:complement C1r subcomponent-like protein [Cricetulus griseus]XP_027284024.1 complement C1r subcomponent-like protein [Cricetulus griseus]